MGATIPRQKGTGLLALVKALLMYPGGKEAVPANLQHYFDNSVLPSAWYPEADYNVLIQILANLVAPNLKTDVWEFFGKTAAQRDLAGEQGLVSAASRIETAGLYRGFVGSEATSVASLFVRLRQLWSIYHDAGTMTAGRSPSDERVVIVRLVGFEFPNRGTIDLQMAYAREYARLVGIELQACVARSAADGDPCTEWHYTLPARPEFLESIAQMPLLP
jgi:hypothetical protein